MILNKHKIQQGITLLEILVVIGVVGIVMTIITEIFYRSLRVSLRAQIQSAMKQNGQFAIDTMDKVIRDGEKVVCRDPDTIIVFKEGLYTRFKFNGSTSSGGINYNGYISQDRESGCANLPASDMSKLTDTNQKTGVSISGGQFTASSSTGFKDTVTITFTVEPAKEAPSSVASQVSVVPFTTTVKLR